MSTAVTDDNETTHDNWQVIGSVKEAMNRLVDGKDLDKHHRFESTSFNSLNDTDKEFVLQRVRGFQVSRQEGDRTRHYKLIWNPAYRNFSVKQTRES